MDGLEMIYTRRSVRSFKPDLIDDTSIDQIVKAGKLAATARNVQPIDIVVVKDQSVRDLLGETTEYGKFIPQAPVCFVVFSEDTKYYLEDGSAAIENILLAARYFGIGTCWVAGDKKPYADDIREICQMKPGYKLIGLVAAGYPESDTFFQKKDIRNPDAKIL